MGQDASQKKQKIPMDNYTDVFYNQKKTDYPFKLCCYLIERFSIPKGSKILDVGVGNGDHFTVFEREGLRAWGVDILVHEDPKVKQCDLTRDEIPFRTNTFDVVFTKSCIEHLKPVEHPLKEMKRVLKPGGKIIAMVPDWTSNLKWYYDGYDHVSPMTRMGLRDLLRYIGFRDVICEYFYQLPFTWHSDIAKIVPKVLSLLPDSIMWKDDHNHRPLIRFSKLKMLLAVGEK